MVNPSCLILRMITAAVFLSVQIFRIFTLNRGSYLLFAGYDEVGLTFSPALDQKIT